MVFLPMLIKFANANQLFVPRTYRRLHSSNVSALGGLAIFVSSTISFLLFSDVINYPDNRMVISSAFLIFVLGLRDDLFEMTPLYKFLGQLVSVIIIVVFAKVRIVFLQNHIDGALGIYLDVLASIVIVVGIINAYNWIDGIDMLAATVGIIILSFLGTWFFIVQQFDYSLALLSIASALFAFSIYNYSPAKIFMGDTGTMTIALIMSVSLLKFDAINTLIDGSWKFHNAPAIAFTLISFLIYDMSRVILLRIYRRKSPVKGDKNHIHHIMTKIGWSPTKISISIAVLLIIQLAVTVLMDKYSSSIGLILINVAILSLFYAVIIGYFLPKSKSNNIKSV
jgi:UDP-N-acetylmuramyl pentapeptide phosphotransferase/UDP-N-acetylglucosamine-1-phosphate transferase